MKSRLIFFFTLSWGICLTLSADQITLKNGDRVSGKIVTSDDKTVILKTDFAGEIKIDRTLITGITTDGPVNVTLKDSGTVQAKIAGPTDDLQIQKTDGSTVVVKGEGLVAIRDDASQKAWER